MAFVSSNNISPNLSQALQVIQFFLLFVLFACTNWISSGHISLSTLADIKSLRLISDFIEDKPPVEPILNHIETLSFYQRLLLLYDAYFSHAASFIGLLCNILQLVIILIHLFNGSPTKPFHQHRSRWKLKQAFPASWMILSAVMLNPSTAAMFQLSPQYKLKSPSNIPLHPDLLWRPSPMHPFVPRPSPYIHHFSSSPTIAPRQKVLFERECAYIDTKKMMSDMQDLVKEGQELISYYDDILDAIHETEWLALHHIGHDAAQRLQQDEIFLDMNRLCQDDPFIDGPSQYPDFIPSPLLLKTSLFLSQVKSLFKSKI
jgi:hypothetical protein